MKFLYNTVQLDFEHDFRNKPLPLYERHKHICTHYQIYLHFNCTFYYAFLCQKLCIYRQTQSLLSISINYITVFYICRVTWRTSTTTITSTRRSSFYITYLTQTNCVHSPITKSTIKINFLIKLPNDDELKTTTTTTTTTIVFCTLAGTRRKEKFPNIPAGAKKIIRLYANVTHIKT